MSIFGPYANEEPEGLSEGESGSSSDPIARNEKDIHPRADGATDIKRLFADPPSDTSSSKTIQSAEVSRRNGVPAVALGSPVSPGQPWGMNRGAQPAASPGELLASVLRFKWTLLLVAILVSAPMIALVWTQVVPQYRARAEVRIRPIIPRLVFRTEDNGAIPYYESFVNTQVNMMRSLTVLGHVLDRPDVKGTQWYQNTPTTLMERLLDDSTPPLERLRGSLSATPRRRTEIIDVSFTDASARDAEVIVNAVLDQYLAYTGESSSEEEGELHRQLAKQHDTLEGQIVKQEEALAGLRSSLQTQMPEELISAKRLHLDEMEIRLRELRNTIAMLEWEIDQTTGRGSDDSSPVADAAPDRQPDYHADASWRELQLNVRTLEHQIAIGIQKAGHPDRLRLAKDLEFARTLLKECEDRLDTQWRNRPTGVAAGPMTRGAGGFAYQSTPVSLEHQLARAQEEEELISSDYSKEQEEFATLFENAQALARATSALQNKRQLFNAVRQRLEEKEIEGNVPGSIDVVTRAFSSSEPTKDRRVVFTAMALVLGLGMGGGAAFLRGSRSEAIHSPRDIPQPARVPFLGNIPLVKTRRTPGKSVCDEADRNRSRLLESVRVLRTALLSRLSGQEGATVLVTSADEGTGKSSFTMMLGKSIALAGRRVLIVDADFYKASLSKRFELADQPGLVDFLRDKEAGRLPIYPTETTGLEIMPAGNHDGTESTIDEIANGAFRACISRIRQHCNYDVVLFDASPILPVADAMILAGQVDGTIVIEREDVSIRSHVVSALDRLDSAGGRLLGTVLVGSSRREHYGYGYGYGSHGSKSKES